jgi:hypothetical protein
MKRWNGSPGVLAVCALLLAACGGISQEDYPEKYREALCHRKARCGQIRDEDACVRESREFARAMNEAGMSPYQMYEGSFRSGRLRFDEDLAEACVERIRDSSCDQSLGEARAGDVCHILVGQQKDGEPCLLYDECGPASYCERMNEAVCAEGTCKPGLGLGQTLTNGMQQCAPGLIPVEGICQAFLGEGDTCAGSDRCALGLFCNIDTRTCQRFATEGGTCGTGGGICLSHLRCIDGSCRRLADVGEACAGGCKEDLFCDRTTDSEPGSCRERRGLGEPCNDVYGYVTCRANLVCGNTSGGMERTCQPPAEVGASCANMSCGLGAWCDWKTETCKPQGKMGGACDSYQMGSCMQGLSCVENTCRPGFPGPCWS